MAKTVSSVIYDPVAYENATHQYIVNNARKTFAKNNPRYEEIADFLYAENYKTKPFELWASFYDALFNKYGKLTEKQVACVLKAIDKRTAQKAEWVEKKAAADAKSEFVGEVGDKIQIRLTVQAVIEIAVPAFSYYDSGVSWINILKDSAENIYVYRGKTFVGNKGETVVLKASIKEHSVYNGVKQNVIQRPKLVSTINKEEKEAA